MRRSARTSEPCENCPFLTRDFLDNERNTMAPTGRHYKAREWKSLPPSYGSAGIRYLIRRLVRPSPELSEYLYITWLAFCSLFIDGYSTDRTYTTP